MSRVTAVSLARTSAIAFGGFSSLSPSSITGNLPVRVVTLKDRTDPAALRGKEGRAYLRSEEKGPSLTLNLIDPDREQAASLRFEAPVLEISARSNPGGIVSSMMEGRSVSSFELKGQRLTQLMDELAITWDRSGVGIKAEVPAPPPDMARSAQSPGSPTRPGSPGRPGSPTGARLNLAI
jgi:hypothetical protein